MSAAKQSLATAVDRARRAVGDAKGLLTPDNEALSQLVEAVEHQQHALEGLISALRAESALRIDLDHVECEAAP